MNDEPERTATVFIVSAWLEPDAHPRVRARVRYTTATRTAPETTTAVASAEDACRLLRQWWDAVSGSEEMGSQGTER